MKGRAFALGEAGDRAAEPGEADRGAVHGFVTGAACTSGAPVISDNSGPVFWLKLLLRGGNLAPAVGESTL